MAVSFNEDLLTQMNKSGEIGSEKNWEKKAKRLSASYYNEGLKRAKVRDLTGAISMLKFSLKFDKGNVDARNLLGLIYSEMGDTVVSLGEWVISRHFREKENLAEQYLSYFQSNPTRLDTANQVIKKYNSAVKAVRTGSEDLAVIQLKKVIDLNPNHLKALQLLSLLSIKNKQYRQAARHLKTARKIDSCNPTTLLYLSELKALGEFQEKTSETKQERVLFADSDSFAPVSSYKEDKPSILPWINFVLGIVLGVTFFAVVMLPGIRAKSVEGKLAEIVSLNETLAETNASLSQLEGKNVELKKEIEELNRKAKLATHSQSKKGKTEEKSYIEALIDAANFFVVGEEKRAAESLVKVDREKIEDKEALNLYNQLSGKLFEKQSADLFIEGRNLYNNGRFDLALPKLEESLKMNPLNVDSMYFIGRAYDRKGEKDKAKEWYEKVIKEFADTGRAAEAKQKLRLLGGN